MRGRTVARVDRRAFFRGAAAAAAAAPLLALRSASASAMAAPEMRREPTDVRGYTKPGFGRVRDVFVREAYLMGTGGAAFAATKDDEIVVDLWAGMADHGRPWARNTRVHVQSTSKAVTAMTAMHLVERGELDLDAKVGRYWPEYGVNGKQETTVRMLLSHAAGSTRLPGYTELLDLDGNGFDRYEEIASRLAAAEPDWAPGTAHGYHGYTYGNLVSEVVYRITGKRAGEFLRDEIAGPWLLNTWLGTPYEEQRELAAIKTWPVAPMHDKAAQAYADMAAQAGDAGSSPLLDPDSWQYDAGFKKLLGGPLDVFFMQVGLLWSQPRALAAEFGAANVTSDARSLARLYTPLATGGVLDGRRVFRPATVSAFITPAPPGGADKVLSLDMKWTPGSHHTNRSLIPGLPAIYGPNPDAFGMSGGGGNYGFADPAAGIAGGFVRNHYTNTMALSSLLVEAVYASL